MQSSLFFSISLLVLLALPFLAMALPIPEPLPGDRSSSSRPHSVMRKKPEATESDLMVVKSSVKIFEAVSCVGALKSERKQCPMPPWTELERAAERLDNAREQEMHSGLKKILLIWSKNRGAFEQAYRHVQVDGCEAHLEEARIIRTLRNVLNDSLLKNANVFFERNSVPLIDVYNAHSNMLKYRVERSPEDIGRELDL